MVDCCIFICFFAVQFFLLIVAFFSCCAIFLCFVEATAVVSPSFGRLIFIAVRVPLTNPPSSGRRPSASLEHGDGRCSSAPSSSLKLAGKRQPLDLFDVVRSCERKNEQENISVATSARDLKPGGSKRRHAGSVTTLLHHVS